MSAAATTRWRDQLLGLTLLALYAVMCAALCTAAGDGVGHLAAALAGRRTAWGALAQMLVAAVGVAVAGWRADVVITRLRQDWAAVSAAVGRSRRAGRGRR